MKRWKLLSVFFLFSIVANSISTDSHRAQSAHDIETQAPDSEALPWARVLQLPGSPVSQGQYHRHSGPTRDNLAEGRQLDQLDHCWWGTDVTGRRRQETNFEDTIQSAVEFFSKNAVDTISPVITLDSDFRNNFKLSNRELPPMQRLIRALTPPRRRSPQFLGSESDRKMSLLDAKLCENIDLPELRHMVGKYSNYAPLSNAKSAIAPEQSITWDINLFASAYNEADGNEKMRLMSHFQGCLASQESLKIADGGDRFAKEYQQSRNPGVHWARNAGNTEAGIFQFSPWKKGRSASASGVNYGMCVSVWNEIHRDQQSCQIGQNPQDFTRAVAGSGQSFSSLCANIKLLESFYVQRYSYGRAFTSGNNVKDGVLLPPKDRCVSLFFRNSYQNFGPLRGGRDMIYVAQCAAMGVDPKTIEEKSNLNLATERFAVSEVNDLMTAMTYRFGCSDLKSRLGTFFSQNHLQKNQVRRWKRRLARSVGTRCGQYQNIYADRLSRGAVSQEFINRKIESCSEHMNSLLGSVLEAQAEENPFRRTQEIDRALAQVQTQSRDWKCYNNADIAAKVGELAF